MPALFSLVKDFDHEVNDVDTDLPGYEINDVSSCNAKGLVGVIALDLIVVFFTRLMRQGVIGSPKRRTVSVRIGDEVLTIGVRSSLMRWHSNVSDRF